MMNLALNKSILVLLPRIKGFGLLILQPTGSKVAEKRLIEDLTRLVAGIATCARRQAVVTKMPMRRTATLHGIRRMLNIGESRVGFMVNSNQLVVNSKKSLGLLLAVSHKCRCSTS